MDDSLDQDFSFKKLFFDPKRYEKSTFEKQMEKGAFPKSSGDDEDTCRFPLENKNYDFNDNINL